MKLCVISFTRSGKKLAEKIGKMLQECGRIDTEIELGKGIRTEENELCKLNKLEIILYTKYKGSADETSDAASDEICERVPGFAQSSYVVSSLREWTKEQMEERNALLFIGACGIAVRAVAPYLEDKLHDGPVLVMDERGTYVIPILSGHVGGANELARYLAEKTGAVPVITTATDINDKFAVDLFAKENDLSIVNKEGIAEVSAKVLAGEEITICAEPGYGSGLPEGVRVEAYPPERYVDILITSEGNVHDAAILLRPKEYAIGLGCRKGKCVDEIEDFVVRKLKECGISTTQIFALSSISLKSKEQGIIRWCRKERIPFVTYTAKELQAVEGDFIKSSFVQEHTGVDNVCERAALKACGAGGQLICEKCAENGITFALAKRVRKRQA